MHFLGGGREAERRAICSDERTQDACATLHSRKVERIARDLHQRRSTAPLSLHKRAVSHMVPKADDGRRADDFIDISDLNAIVSVDPAAHLCVAESGVTFVDLVAATMRHGLVPLIVPELKTITIGGAVSGCSLESMSWKYGGFHDTCVEYEVVTARGDVVVARPDNEHSLLFQMMQGSFGTLGILSKLTFRLVPAKPFVKVVYERHRQLSDYLGTISGHCESEDLDFMDGFVHSMSAFVLATGRFVDEAPYTSRYDWTKVYYRSTRTRPEDYLRVPDYYFRYDHGVTGVHPKSFAGRLLFGKLFGSTELLRAAQWFHSLLTGGRVPFTLDVFIPFSKVTMFLEWYAEAFRHFPLWCVPYRPRRQYEWLSKRFFETAPDPLFLDFAIYDFRPGDQKHYHRLMEEKLFELGGLKTLISSNYYTEEEFWTIWNRSNYERVKALTDPDNILRDLYSKTHRANAIPPRR